MKTENLIDKLPLEYGPCFVVSEAGEVKAVVMSYSLFLSEYALPKEKIVTADSSASNIEESVTETQTVSIQKGLPSELNTKENKMENVGSEFGSQFEHDEELDVSLNYEADPADVLVGLMNP